MTVCLTWCGAWVRDGGRAFCANSAPLKLNSPVISGSMGILMLSLYPLRFELEFPFGMKVVVTSKDGPVMF